jgi:hypothetical protein
VVVLAIMQQVEPEVEVGMDVVVEEEVLVLPEVEVVMAGLD